MSFKNTTIFWVIGSRWCFHREFRRVRRKVKIARYSEQWQARTFKTKGKQTFKYFGLIVVLHDTRTIEPQLRLTGSNRRGAFIFSVPPEQFIDDGTIVELLTLWAPIETVEHPRETSKDFNTRPLKSSFDRFFSESCKREFIEISVGLYFELGIIKSASLVAA